MMNKLKCKTSLAEELAEQITIKFNRQLNKNGLELIKMKLGLEILLINLTKFAIVFIIAAAVNLFKEALLMTLVFGSVRRNAFGLHAKNSIVCTLTTTAMLVGGPYVSYYIKTNNYIIFGIFLMLNFILYKYAPADTENHPILGEKLRRKLRKETVLTGTFLMFIALIVQSQAIKVMITLAVSFEVITILPITYKILNRGYKNYDKYERAIS